MMGHRLRPICLRSRLFGSKFGDKSKCFSYLTKGEFHQWSVSRSVLGNCRSQQSIRFYSNGVQSVGDGEDDGDFFGIKYFSADDIKGIEGLDEKKKKRLEEKATQIKTLEGCKATEDGFMRKTSFGKVRYDRENQVDYMGQYDNSEENVMIEKRRNYLLEIALLKEIDQNDDKRLTQSEQKTGSEFIDDQYFNVTNAETKEDDGFEKKSIFGSTEDLNYIDYQYFQQTYSPEMTDEGLPAGPIKFHYASHWDEYNESLSMFGTDRISNYRRSPDDLLENLDNLTFSGDSPLRSVEEVTHELMLTKQRFEDQNEHEEVEETFTSDDPSEEKDEIETMESNTPKTALEYILKIRQGQLQPEDKAYLAHLETKYKKIGSEFKFRKSEDHKKVILDSTGKRNFLEQKPKLHQLRRDELIELLKQRVIFNERDLIALDKPNGLIVEGGSSNSKYPSLESLLPHLSKALFNSENELFIVHRLDRDATGVLLLARSLSMLNTLRDMFVKRAIKKYYWAITKAIPDPLTGIIDIPIEACSVNGIERMCLKPECDADFDRRMGLTKGASPAVTHYRVLRQKGNACLVEVKPEQGIKHQIRVHLGFGLRTPILGDHKYSYLEKVAPQRLPDDILKSLNVRQTKVRNIPLHLHSKMYIVPEVGVNGGSVTIPAHLPGFFRANMSSLGLYSQTSVIKSPIAF